MPPAANGRVDPPPNFPSLNQIPGATPLTSDAHAGRWNGPNKLKRPPRRPTRFSFSALRRSFSPSLSPSSTGSEHAQKPPPPIGHQARICYVVMTGAVPPQDKSEGMCKEKREAVGEKTSRGQSLSEVNSLGQEEGSREIAATHKGGAKAITPVVKTKAVRKLKSDLLRPVKLRSLEQSEIMLITFVRYNLGQGTIDYRRLEADGRAGWIRGRRIVRHNLYNRETTSFRPPIFLSRQLPAAASSIELFCPGSSNERRCAYWLGKREIGCFRSPRRC
jgi:hypothetical protein